jgi:hypothetical protein
MPLREIHGLRVIYRGRKKTLICAVILDKLAVELGCVGKSALLAVLDWVFVTGI